MYSNDEKLRMIKQEIDQTTEEMVGAILDKVQKKRISRLSDAEAKANEEAALMVEKAKRDAKTRETTAVSRATLQYRTQLLQKSEAYAQEICRRPKRAERVCRQRGLHRLHPKAAGPGGEKLPVRHGVSAHRPPG